MKFKILAFVLASSALLVSAEDRPDEQLILADCGIGANGDSSSRQMLYYRGRPWDRNQNPVAPDMNVNVPWDGSYPWRLSGVSAKFPNGDVFSVHIDPAVRDLDIKKNNWAGSATHLFGISNFICYGDHDHSKTVFTLPDGATCKKAYGCLHDDFSASAPTETTFTMAKDTVNISAQSRDRGKFGALLSPKDAFQSIKDRLLGNTCDPTPFPISDQCSITFDECDFPGGQDFIDDHRDELVKFFTNATGVAVAKTEKNDHYVDERLECSDGPANPRNPFCHRIKTNVYTRSYEYPKWGKLIISNVKDANSPSAQATVRFLIRCGSGGLGCNDNCLTVAETIISLGSLAFPPASLFGVFKRPVCDDICH
ncbi:hypothetical protein IQ06DRAFT_296642 [Phaeosphaeriaceae sp. SRC1lsM3a]|nr:hypothetical protein IQ06DRAFT_296642 [Stagonospora sp. SRC1lsM3a]